MAQNESSNSITLEAVNLFYGLKECRKVTAVADVAGSLDGTYFDLNIIDNEFNEVLGYVYFNTDPAIAGKTGYAASISNDDTAEDVATAIAAALSGELVKVSQVGAELIIENIVLGEVTDEADSGSTGFSFELLREGIGGELGKINDGGSTLTFDVQKLEITSDQTGQTKLDEFITGINVALEAGLLELTTDRLKTIIASVVGDSYTPAGGTEVIGFGTSKLYKSLIALGGQLVIHPVALPLSDKSKDWVIHKTAPVISDLNFSGQEKQVMNISFDGYIDQSLRSEINLVSRGDWSQDLT